MALEIPNQEGENINLFGHARNFSQGVAAKKIARAMSIPGVAFHPSSITTIIRSDSEGWVGIPAGGDGGVSTEMIAPLILPHQATITSVLVIGTFAAAESWSIYKFQVTGTPSSFPAIATGSMNVKEENIDILIDNENFSYFLTTTALTIDNDVLIAALLDYTS